MAKQTQRLFWLLLTLGLTASACGSPESIIVGAEDDDVTAEPVESGIADAGATVSRDAPYEGPSSVDDLLGTSWIIQTLNGDPYLGEGGLTFFRDSDDLSVAFNDACSAGGGALHAEGNTFRFEPWAPTAGCAGHPAELFSQAGVVLWISLSEEVLSISGSTGTLTATHFQSVSIHDQLIELPSVPEPDVPEPDRVDTADLIEAIDSSIPECDTLTSHALEVDDFDSDVFAALIRLHVVKDELAFVADVGIEEYGPGGTVSIEMSWLYKPTIDWLSENLGSTPACLRVSTRSEPDGSGTATTIAVVPATTIAEG